VRHLRECLSLARAHVHGCTSRAWWVGVSMHACAWRAFHIERERETVHTCTVHGMMTLSL
jgi:hypothetical protein